MRQKKSVRPSVQKNSEFYRGAFAGGTFSVSEVKEAHRFRHDFAKITNFGCFTSKGNLQGPQKGTFFDGFWTKSECLL